jgi:hypothetical protein
MMSSSVPRQNTELTQPCDGKQIPCYVVLCMQRPCINGTCVSNRNDRVKAGVEAQIGLGRWATWWLEGAINEIDVIAHGTLANVR